jgi:hypothetical protein
VLCKVHVVHGSVDVALYCTKSASISGHHHWLFDAMGVEGGWLLVLSTEPIACPFLDIAVGGFEVQRWMLVGR